MSCDFKFKVLHDGMERLLLNGALSQLDTRNLILAKDVEEMTALHYIEKYDFDGVLSSSNFRA